jgi:hypothetical protein
LTQINTDKNKPEEDHEPDPMTPDISVQADGFSVNLC